jgi:hypothetical protein
MNRQRRRNWSSSSSSRSQLLSSSRLATSSSSRTSYGRPGTAENAFANAFYERGRGLSSNFDRPPLPPLSRLPSLLSTKLSSGRDFPSFLNVPLPSDLTSPPPTTNNPLRTRNEPSSKVASKLANNALLLSSRRSQVSASGDDIYRPVPPPPDLSRRSNLISTRLSARRSFLKFLNDPLPSDVTTTSSTTTNPLKTRNEPSSKVASKSANNALLLSSSRSQVSASGDDIYRPVPPPPDLSRRSSLISTRLSARRSFLKFLNDPLPSDVTTTATTTTNPLKTRNEPSSKVASKSAKNALLLSSSRSQVSVSGDDIYRPVPPPPDLSRRSSLISTRLSTRRNSLSFLNVPLPSDVTTSSTTTNPLKTRNEPSSNVASKSTNNALLLSSSPSQVSVSGDSVYGPVPPPPAPFMDKKDIKIKVHNVMRII